MRIWRKVKKNLRKYQHLLWNPINRITFFLNAVSCGSGLESYGKVYVINDDGEINIGKDVRMNSGDWTTAIGSGHRIWIHVKKNAKLKIGNHVGISNAGIVCMKEIVIEDNVLLGSGCRIYDTDFHGILSENRLDETQIVTKPILISQNVFIGSDVTILKGVTIGEGSVVGAGSVVAKDIPPNQIWAGNPARFIKKVE